MEENGETNRKKAYCCMILLAGGSGKRMNSDIPKQFMQVSGKPLICYSLEAVEKSAYVDECILVAAKRDLVYMQEKILNNYAYSKVSAVAEGGSERYESVLSGLNRLRKMRSQSFTDDIVMIHDGARPFLTEELIRRCFEGAVKFTACVAAVPSKDTIAIADREGFEYEIPERKQVWSVQTPQSFRTEVVFEAFDHLREELAVNCGERDFSWVTDDAGVVEHYANKKIKLLMGDYRNIKVTTPDDLAIVERFLEQNEKNEKK